MTSERVRLRIGNVAKAVLVSGQAYQDPKDALNEFVSNAADEYVLGGQRGERVRVILRRKGRTPMIAVEDTGRGLSPDRLRELTRSLFDSAKAGDRRTIGEKAIGLLAFQQLGGKCDIVSRAVDSNETWCLRLERGKAIAYIEQEKRRARTLPGTTVYLYDLDPDVVRLFTQRKIADYLRTRRGAALARGDYSIEVVEGRTGELVTPERPDGIKLNLPSRQTLWGRIECNIFVSPPDAKVRRVAVVGRGGTTIIDDVCELEEFDNAPWNTDQLSGQVVFEGLQQSAGRRAVIRDREAFPIFVDAMRSVEPSLSAAIVQVTREVDGETADRMGDAIRKVFGRVLRELDDLENPMRSTTVVDAQVGLEFGAPTGAPTAGQAHPAGDDDGESAGDDADPDVRAWQLPEPTTFPPPPPPVRKQPRDDSHGADTPDPVVAPLQPGDPLPPPTPRPVTAPKPRSTSLPSLEIDPAPGQQRSRFDADQKLVLYNDRHADYLLVKDDEVGLLDYLATLVAKEYVLYNNPRAGGDELAEEMVRMLVRVRRHLPKRAPKRPAVNGTSGAPR